MFLNSPQTKQPLAVKRVILGGSPVHPHAWRLLQKTTPVKELRCSDVPVNAYQPALRGGKALICDMCQRLWCKYSHQGPLQTTSLTFPKTRWGRDADRCTTAQPLASLLIGKVQIKRGKVSHRHHQEEPEQKSVLIKTKVSLSHPRKAWESQHNIGKCHRSI